MYASAHRKAQPCAGPERVSNPLGLLTMSSGSLTLKTYLMTGFVQSPVFLTPNPIFIHYSILSHYHNTTALIHISSLADNLSSKLWYERAWPDLWDYCDYTPIQARYRILQFKVQNALFLIFFISVRLNGTWSWSINRKFFFSSVFPRSPIRSIEIKAWCQEKS